MEHKNGTIFFFETEKVVQDLEDLSAVCALFFFKRNASKLSCIYQRRPAEIIEA
jgi:hypothetical protein